MHRNKILCLVLSFIIAGGLISSASISVHASEINDVKVGQQSETFTNNKVQVKGFRTQVAKVALKSAAKALRSSGLRSTLNGLKYVGFGTKTVNNIVKNSGKIANILDNLSTWSYVIEQTIYDQVAGALGGGTVARDVAWWISKLVSWGLL